jgi:hypothetical protein
VPWPLPWPRDASDIPELAIVAAAAKKARYRLQLLVPAPERGERLLVRYVWDPLKGHFAGVEVVVSGNLPDAALELLAGESPEGGRDVEGSDVLICGHGRRDRCCGSLGTALESVMSEPGRLAAGVRVWRTSHTGGHRFAPTALILPEGTSWAYLDPSALVGIVERSQPVTSYLNRYRGCAGLSGPAVQVVERAVLAQHGWGVLDCPRQGTDMSDGVAELTVVMPEGQRAWEGRVSVRRSLSVPGCGSPAAPGDKVEDEHTLSGLAMLPLGAVPRTPFAGI